MNKTTNYGLNLPEVGEFYDVNLVNENTQILDAKLKELEDFTNTPQGSALMFSDVHVAMNIWANDTTYEDFPYRADIACDGVTEEYFPEVTFDVPEAISGNYAPVAKTGNGTVSIYSKTVPESAITIPVIKCEKVVSA